MDQIVDKDPNGNLLHFSIDGNINLISAIDKGFTVLN